MCQTVSGISCSYRRLVDDRAATSRTRARQAKHLFDTRISFCRKYARLLFTACSLAQLKTKLLKLFRSVCLAALAAIVLILAEQWTTSSAERKPQSFWLRLTRTQPCTTSSLRTGLHVSCHSWITHIWLWLHRKTLFSPSLGPSPTLNHCPQGQLGAMAQPQDLRLLLYLPAL